MCKEIHIEWGKASDDMLPTTIEMLNTLKELRKKALDSSTVHMRTRRGVTDWLRDHMDNAYVWIAERSVGSDGTDRIIVAPDIDTARTAAKAMLMAKVIRDKED